VCSRNTEINFGGGPLEGIMPKPAADGEERLENKSEDALRQALNDLVGEVDHEGLVFLIRQARVLLYNKKVEEFNRKIGEAKVEKSVKKVTNSIKRSASHGVEIVERGEGKHFFIVVNSFRIYFTLEEMRHLVRISHAAEDERDGARRLYNWFRRERSDFLVDGGITDYRNPSLVDLYDKLVHTYKPKK
jgi:hypothetical protein